MFLLISGGHIGAPKLYTNMASPYKALQKWVKRFGKQLRNCAPKDLRIGQIVYILVFYNTAFFLASSVGRFPIYFFFVA